MTAINNYIQSYENINACPRECDSYSPRPFRSEVQESLKKKLRNLQSENARLNRINKDLNSTVSGLREFVKRIDEQRNQQLEMLRIQNQQKEEKIMTLQCALKTNQEEGGHLKRIGEFWALYC